MANEEQRKAFASYMGGSSSNASAEQPTPQYPGSVASPASQYLFNVLADYSYVQQFPGFGAYPAAPTPPPAAASSIVSYQGLQGGFAPQGNFGQAIFPQRPPPLGRGQGQGQGRGQPRGTQLIPVHPRPPGYAQLPPNYASRPPAPSGLNVGSQYEDLTAPQSAGANTASATSSFMSPLQRNVSSCMYRNKDTDEYSAYRYGTSEEALPHMEEHTVPVLLCHTCSDCGQMRSARYHRNHPVIPGKPIVTTPCRKCKKTRKTAHRSSAASYTRVRTCAANEPCDWPGESLHVDIGHGERRSRRRIRDKIYASWRTDSLRSSEHVIKERSSHANIGLRTMQKSPPRGYRSMARVRVSSLSPRRSRYDGVWPPPDVISIKSLTSNELSPTNEVWPPPDVVHTHLYRKKVSPCPNPRIVELSLSPPSARSTTTRLRYREASEERRGRSPLRRRESRIRLESHPHPYRTVIPDCRMPLKSDEASSNDADSESVNRGILKPADMTCETSYRRRTGLRDSQQSTSVEVGGPRVQFVTERRDEPRPSERIDDHNHERYLRHERRRYVDEPASPPIDRMERLLIRCSSSSPQKIYDEIRVDRERHISPSPPRGHEEVRFRHVSVSPRCPRGRARRHLPCSASLERSVHSGYRHVSRAKSAGQARSLTPSPSVNQISSEDDVTDSEDDERDGLVEVRSWKGIDENGQPATFVEERREIKMIDKATVDGSEFRPSMERLSARSWRQV